MGREIRMVPPNWEHPITEDEYRRKRAQPMYDQRFDERFAEWLADFDRIRRGELTALERDCYTSANPLAEWLKDEGAPPDPAYYRPWADEEATWVQVWETVSEGTPVTPPFASREELIDYLATNGDFWDQHRGDGPWKRENAHRFVAGGWAPSLIAVSSPEGVETYAPRDGIPPSPER